MKLRPTETELIGAWLEQDGRVVADHKEQRIEWLIQHSLKKLASTTDSWSTLYQDVHDGRLWELGYPRSETHGGGPHRLAIISHDEIARKYGLDVLLKGTASAGPQHAPERTGL